ncbi:hypothetical protein KQI77_03830 [Clostridium sp. MSJ-8]|uniref:tetratricopeptide repeat protein n=1 Tax=Clostridium sp. MSJ-8 TaxID=2841510 RepID=UPI001C0F38D5|nr:hypothetical protein [Clostridium sp. MSJ-8]MBU5487291.1 hypothetical protein [Clostridium sp. MSJ-8]
MFRIKLPGNNKTKVILLIIMIALAIGIIVKVGIDNNKKRDVNNSNENKINASINEDLNHEQKDNKEEKLEEEEKISEREEALYQEAFSIFHSGDYALAINKADALIAEYPNSYKGYNIRGIAKAYNGNFQEGMADIDKSLSINNNYAYALFNKGLNYELYGYYEDALSWYERELVIEEYSWGYYGMASIYGRYGNVDKTVEYLSKALDTADKEGIKDNMIEEAKIEADFDSVRNSEKFNNLLLN